MSNAHERTDRNGARHHTVACHGPAENTLVKSITAPREPSTRGAAAEQAFIRPYSPSHRPRDVDKDCAEQDGSVYRNCKYMTTIIAGSPGDHELTLDGMCPGDEGARS